MIEIYYKKVKDVSLKKLPAFRIGSWIYVEDPTKSEIRSLAKTYGLEMSLINDAIDPYEIPRMEIENSIVYVYARVPYKEGERVTTTPVMIGVSSDFVVTVSQKPLPFLTVFKEIKNGFTTTQRTKLFIHFFLSINALFNSYVTDINKQLRKTIVSPQKIKDKDIFQFVSFEETLNEFLSDLSPMSRIVKSLLSGKFLKLYKEDEELVEDILITTEQLIDTCGSNLKTIVNIREAYSAIVTNNLNRVIKVLTVLTIVLTIPTITASLYGMNVSLPFGENKNAFWFVLGITLLISTFVLYILKKKDWI